MTVSTRILLRDADARPVTSRTAPEVSRVGSAPLNPLVAIVVEVPTAAKRVNSLLRKVDLLAGPRAARGPVGVEPGTVGAQGNTGEGAGAVSQELSVVGATAVADLGWFGLWICRSGGKEVAPETQEECGGDPTVHHGHEKDEMGSLLSRKVRES